MAGQNTVEITVRTNDETGPGMEKAGQGATGLTNKFKTVAASAGGMLAGAAIAKGVSAFTGFMSGTVKASTDLGESVNAVNLTFGKSAGTILDWGKNNATSFGLSQRAFNALATPLGAGLANSGMAMQDASRWTIDLTKRAADMASVFNVDVNEAMAAIQSGLRGEADPLEAFGVGLSAAAVEAEALAETGKKSAKALTNQEIMTARLNLIMKQTQKTAGDFTNTSDGLANSERIAAAKTEELQAQIGAKLAPAVLLVTKAKMALVQVIADKLVPVLVVVADWMGKHSTTMKIVGAVIGAVLVGAFIAWAAAAASAAAATLAATWPIIAIVAAIALVVAGFVKLYQSSETFRTIVQAVMQAAAAAFNLVVNAAKNVVNWIVSNWGTITDILAAPFKLAWILIQAGFEVIKAIITGAVTVIKAIWGVITDVLTLPFKLAWAVIQGIFELMKAIFAPVIAVVKAIWGPLSEILALPFRLAWAIILLIFEVIKQLFLDGIRWIQSVWGPVTEFISAPFKLAWTVIQAIWAQIKATIQAVIDWIKTAWATVTEALSGPVRVAVDFIKTVLFEIYSFVTDTINKVKAVWDKITNVLSGPVTTAVDAVKRIFGTIYTAVSGTIDNVIKLVSGLGSRAVSAIGNTSKLLWNAGVQFISGLWDGMIARFNQLIKWVNDVRAWVAANKGPISKDRQTLVPAGEAFMEGLLGGLQSGARPVTSWLNQFTSDVGGAGGARTAPGGMAGGGAAPAAVATGGGVAIEIHSGGSALDDLLLEVMRRAVRVRGGDAQVVLGGRR